MEYSVIVQLIFVLNSYVHCANILGIMPVHSPSHHIWNRVIMNELAAKGHNVTVLSCDKDSNTPSNLNYIHLEQTYSDLYDNDEFDLSEHSDESEMAGIRLYYYFQYSSCRGSFKSNGFQQLLNYPDNFKFDLIIFDFTLGPCLLGFAHKFNYPPVIGISAFNNPPFTHQVVGGHKYYAYIPYYSLSYGTEMNFGQRIYNRFIHAYDEIYRTYIVAPKIDKWTKTAFRNPNLPYGGDLETLPKLLLVNSHPAFDFPEPTPPNIIQVGGLQIQEPKPLPDDLEKFVTDSKKGFVLFSLGTNVRSDELPAAKKQMFLDVMAQFRDYNFLWKFESDLDMKLPKNVIIQNWLPQSDLLGHPKIKAFITHSGLLSTHEAVWYGVPMIAIPFLADQHRNSYRIVELGMGEKLTFTAIATASFKSTLEKVLENPRYKQNALNVSKKFRDRELKPLDTAVWWVEYILRHPDSDHLRSPTLKLGYFRSNLYDIMAFFVISIILAVILVKIFICRFIKKSDEDNSISNKKYK